MTGSENGKVILWSMEDIPAPIFQFTEDSTIRCSLYVKQGNTRYLILGVHNRVCIKTIQDVGCVHYTELKGHTEVNDLAYDKERILLFAGFWNGTIRVYQGERFKEIGIVDTSIMDIKAPIASVFYLNNNFLGIENSEGLFVINYES
jgi:hypothetical protein